MKMIFMTGLLVLSFTAVAADKGNGGISVVCRDKDDTITYSRLLDIYEGEVRGKNYKTELTEEELIERALLRTRNRSTHFFELLQMEVEKVIAKMVVVPLGNMISKTNDFSTMTWKVGCRSEQLANYTKDGDILVSKGIYDSLDTLNKAALVIHEAVFSIRRKASLVAIKSDSSRKLTTQLMAEDADQDAIDQWINSFYPKTSTCGLSGSIQKRIKDCSVFDLDLDPRPKYRLVTQNGTQFYKDTTTGNIFVFLSDTLTYSEAQKGCDKYNKDRSSPVSNLRIPTIDELDVDVFNNSKIYNKNKYLYYRLPDSFWSSTSAGFWKMWSSGVVGKHKVKKSSISAAVCVSSLSN